MNRFAWIAVALALAVSAGCDESGKPFALKDVRMMVDFLTATSSALTEGAPALNPMVAQTPAAYRIKICKATLEGATPFELFAHAAVADCPIFSYTEASSDALTIVPTGTVIPDLPFSGIRLQIAWIEMELEFQTLDDPPEARTLRIHYMADGAYLPGDVAAISPEKPTDNWVFGPGNVTDDLEMMGLSRAAAYNMTAWPDGRLIAEGGPFGTKAFWDAHPAPFSHVTPLPTLASEQVVVKVRVADTWHFTDQGADGVYNFPADYGNDWHMDFPELVAVSTQP